MVCWGFPIVWAAFHLEYSEVKEYMPEAVFWGLRSVVAELGLAVSCQCQLFSLLSFSTSLSLCIRKADILPGKTVWKFRWDHVCKSAKHVLDTQYMSAVIYSDAHMHISSSVDLLHQPHNPQHFQISDIWLNGTSQGKLKEEKKQGGGGCSSTERVILRQILRAIWTAPPDLQLSTWAKTRPSLMLPEFLPDSTRWKYEYALLQEVSTWDFNWWFESRRMFTLSKRNLEERFMILLALLISPTRKPLEKSH